MTSTGHGAARRDRPSVASVTSWIPDGGAAEVLSHGGEATRLRRLHLVAAAVALLVVGAAAGAGVAAGFDARPPWAEPAADVPALTGGTIDVAPAATDRHRYQVALFNPGPDAVRGVQVVGVVGRAATVTAGLPVAIAPHSWRPVSFSLPDECGSPAGVLARTLRVRTAGTGAGPGSVLEVELAESAAALRDNHEGECLAPTALTAADLGGLWIVEEAEGAWADLARISLMRFTPDGRFAFDPEGRMFDEGHQGFFGTYRLRGHGLLLRSDGGYACARGYSEVWTTTRLADDLLRLDIVRSSRGFCHNPPGERQVLRRLVPAERLPSTGSRLSGRRP